ncbi:MAG: flagellar motor protein MotB [Elusimicrobia bacterium]|nr:flagellar motor protein MotB [Elusimicrobiota bacterium]MDA8244027.1 flagellar motor protein MotB [Elusimicrobiota bacterium]
MAVKVKGMIPEDDSRVAPIGHPAPPWMVNYADLMTELVCFFVILYALSAALNKDMQKAQQEVQDMIDQGKMVGQVQMDKEGMRITLEEQSQVAFFQSGSAELTPQMTEQMAKLSPILFKLAEKHDIVVEGHTDNIPIRTKQYDSNWELSTARATSVVKSLLADNFPPKHLAAVGYGEYHPIVPNDTEADRKKNRRVVFFIKNNPYPDPTGPPGEKGKAAPAAAEKAPPPPEGGAPAAPEAQAPETPAPAGDAPAEPGP